MCILEIDNFEQTAKNEERLHSKRTPCEDRDGKIIAAKCRQKHVRGVIALLAMSTCLCWMVCRKDFSVTLKVKSSGLFHAQVSLSRNRNRPRAIRYA